LINNSKFEQFKGRIIGRYQWIAIYAMWVVLLRWMGVQPAVGQTPLARGIHRFYDAAPLYVAQDAGILRKHGFRLELVFIAGGSLSTKR
jgi:ABC-type nitrate/sulfonate/bicarbonate transport system substrate-binding protein